MIWISSQGKDDEDQAHDQRHAGVVQHHVVDQFESALYGGLQLWLDVGLVPEFLVHVDVHGVDLFGVDNEGVELDDALEVNVV